MKCPNVIEYKEMKAAAQNGLNVGNFYIVEGPVEPLQGTEIAVESIASCDEGDFVNSIWFNFVVPNAPQLADLNLLSSNPNQTLDGWSASADGLVAGSSSIQAIAVCFDTQ